MTQPLPDINVAWSTQLYVVSGQNAESTGYVQFAIYGGYNSEGVFNYDAVGARDLFEAYKEYSQTLVNPQPYILKADTVVLSDPKQSTIRINNKVSGWDNVEAALLELNLISPTSS